MNEVIEEEHYDEYGNTLKGSDIHEFNYRHDNM